MKKIVFLAVLVAALAVGSNGADPTSYPGKDCPGGDADCENPATSLKCTSGKCQCEGDNKFYFGSSNKCLLPVGAACKDSSDANPTPTTAMTPNAQCKGNQVQCLDTHTFVNTVPGAQRCVIKDQTTCGKLDDCDEDKYHECNAGKCGCGADFLEGDNKVCTRKITKSCKADTAKPFPSPACQESSTCTNNICVCNAGTEDSNGLCRVQYGKTCSNALLCDDLGDFTTCHATQKKCLCKGEGAAAFFDGSKCGLALNQKCEAPAAGKQACAENSMCDTTNPADMKCVCEAGLVKGKGLKCGLVYGGDCTAGTADKCDSAAFLKCDAADGAAGKCACENKDDMIEKAGECQVQANKGCKNEATAPKCVANAKCETNGTVFACKCPAGVTITGECYLDKGATCGTPALGECDPAQFLECTGTTTKKCECNPTTSWYNTVAKRCELLVGQTCVDGQQPCVSPTTVGCVGTTTKTCSCLAVGGAQTQKLEPSKNNQQCVPAYSSVCDPTGATLLKCNEESYLSCDATSKTCTCGADAIADSTNKCVLLAGKKCVANAQECSAQSECKAAAGATDTLCTCKDTYVANSKSLCKLKAGAACGTPDDCNDAGFLKCNATTGGVCACADSKHRLNTKTNICSLPLDAACTADATKAGCDDTFSECKESKCACKGTLVKDGEVCANNYNAACKADDDIKCSATLNLDCKTSKCLCKDKYAYNATQKLCFGDFEAPCGAAKDCDKENHFTCSGTTDKKCTCEAEFEWNVEAKKCGAGTFTLSVATVLIALVSFFARNN